MMTGLTRWDGKAWRADSGFRHDKRTTVKDVYDYEVNELGHADSIYVWDQALDTYGNWPARQALWVCSTKRAASAYGAPRQLDLHGTIVLSDGQAGYYVVKDKRGK